MLAESARDTRWGGGNASLLQVQVLPRQWMVGPRSDSRHCLGETPTGASSAVNCRQRREGEANRPQGQRPAGVSRGGPSWTEFARLADQAVVAIAGAGMTNRAEPRAYGCSRGSRRLDIEPGAKEPQALCQTQQERLRKCAGWLGRASNRNGGKPALRNE